MTSFLKSISFFTLAFAVFIFILTLTNAGAYIDSLTWMILAYFILLTCVFHYGLLISSKGNPQQFVRYYMGATSFKLLIHLVVLIIYCLFHRSEAVRFIISFALFYFVFTVFEFAAVRKTFKK